MSTTKTSILDKIMLLEIYFLLVLIYAIYAFHLPENPGFSFGFLFLLTALLWGIISVLFFALMDALKFVSNKLGISTLPIVIEDCNVKIFNGSLDAILVAFLRNKLKFSKQIGKNYIFSTSFFLLPNARFVVTDMGHYCIVRSYMFPLQFLKEVVLLQRLKDFNKENNQEVVVNV